MGLGCNNQPAWTAGLDAWTSQRIFAAINALISGFCEVRSYSQLHCLPARLAKTLLIKIAGYGSLDGAGAF